MKQSSERDDGRSVVSTQLGGLCWSSGKMNGIFQAGLFMVYGGSGETECSENVRKKSSFFYLSYIIQKTFFFYLCSAFKKYILKEKNAITFTPTAFNHFQHNHNKNKSQWPITHIPLRNNLTSDGHPRSTFRADRPRPSGEGSRRKHVIVKQFYVHAKNRHWQPKTTTTAPTWWKLKCITSIGVVQ